MSDGRPLMFVGPPNHQEADLYGDPCRCVAYVSYALRRNSASARAADWARTVTSNVARPNERTTNERSSPRAIGRVMRIDYPTTPNQRDPRTSANREPRTANREPRTVNREPRTANLEP